MALKLARTALALGAAVSLTAVSLPALAQNVAVVNGTPVPVARADAMLREMVRQGQPNSPQLQQQVREELVKREVLAQAAISKGLATDPGVKQQLKLAEQSVLIRALVANFEKTSPVTDAEVQARYDQLKKQFGDKEYHARHILVPSEDTAKDIIAKLKGGAKFADLAKQYSKDPGSAQNGGDLDWSPANAYVPEFADALQKLQKGQYSQTPVKTQFGYHVLELDDVRDAQIPPLADVKPQLEKQMQDEKLQGFIESLEKKAKIQ
ncbi:peptidylprolyl isomerase [Pandoraea sputorum]|uniref:peptidylprolyl isomerase n=1 Tax=Pandoraea sputorum TaxID=93222 RepID=UPI001E3F7374|nr:peptidylprolyl isomerase [Pandoraea sputorum]MCE4059827.1 peptidylprolyl isomerase [Pandoraea sputorum]